MTLRSWGPERIANTGLAGPQLNQSVAGLTGGGYVVVWQDDSAADKGVRGQIFDAAGNKVGTEMAIAVAPGNDRTLPSVTGLADGGFCVTWTQDSGNPVDNYILGAVYNANGTFVRSQPVVFAFGLDDDSDVARLGSGSVVVWTDPNGGDIDFRIFDAAGVGGAATPVGKVEAVNQIQPAVATSPSQDKFAVVWNRNDQTGVLIKVFGSNGVAVSSDRIVASSASHAFFDPDVTWLANGDAVITWSQVEIGTGWAITGYRIIRPDLAFTSGPLFVDNIYTSNVHLNSDVVALANGGFVIVQDSGTASLQDGEPSSVLIQAFDGNGNKTGGEILVNTTTAGSQFRPKIAALADGRFVVAWADSADSGNIHHRIFDPRDGFVYGSGNSETLYGNDLIADEMNAFGGNDILFGMRGDDMLFGGAGQDIADGGRGDDTLNGESGNDTLIGGLGDDELFGEDGNDTLRGGQGGDILDGGAGLDLADYLTATGGVTAALDATLAGTGDALGDTFAGVERIRGTNFDDTLRGDTQANILFGQNGADTMDGRAGIDRLIGGLGIDTLSGGTQADRFEYAALTEIGDLILDFTAVDDTIVVTGSAFGGGLIAGTLGAALFQSSATNVAANATVRFIFENDVKILWFDADGNGAGAAVMVADLQASATMTNADILIV